MLINPQTPSSALMSAIQLGIGYTVSNLLHDCSDRHNTGGTCTSFCYKTESVVFCWLRNERRGKCFIHVHLNIAWILHSINIITIEVLHLGVWVLVCRESGHMICHCLPVVLLLFAIIWLPNHPPLKYQMIDFWLLKAV